MTKRQKKTTEETYKPRTSKQMEAGLLELRSLALDWLLDATRDRMGKGTGAAKDILATANNELLREAQIRDILDGQESRRKGYTIGFLDEPAKPEVQA